MSRVLALLYGVLCYAISFAISLYAVGFVGGLAVPKSLDSGVPGPLAAALVVDILLLGVFAVQHSVMARPAFKRWWIRIVPQAIERSTYVLLSSLALALLFWQWRALPGSIWRVDNPAGREALWVLFLAGWAIVLISSFLISHFDLLGLRQVWLNLRGREYTYLPFATPLLYRLVRHPLMLGFLVAFWATPHMTGSHLLFSLATTAYILVGLHFEERDLLTYHGAAYEEYRQRVPMVLPVNLRAARRARRLPGSRARR